MINLLSSKQPPFSRVHVPCGDYPDETSGNAAKNDEGQTTIEGLAQSNIALKPRPPDLVVPRKDLLYFFRRELVSGEMEDIVIVPLKRTDEHVAIVAVCIYKALRLRGGAALR